MRSRRLAVLPPALLLALAVAVVGCSGGAGETATSDLSVVTTSTPAVTATTVEPTTTFAPTTTTAPPTTTEDAGDLSEFDYLDPATFPTVELVDAGSEPRAVRVWMPPVGTSVAMTTVLSSESGQTGGGVGSISSDFMATIGATTEIVAVTDEGFVVRTVFDSATVSSSDAFTEGALEAVYSGLIGKAVQQLTRPDGAIVAQAGLDELGQGDVLGNGLGGIATPLPAEPIGVGAVWKADQVIDVDGIRINQTVTSRLVDIQGDQLFIEIEATSTLDPSSEGAGLESVTLEGTSTGTAIWDLSIGMPIVASSESIQLVEGGDPTAPFSVRTVTSIQITAEPVE